MTLRESLARATAVRWSDGRWRSLYANKTLNLDFERALPREELRFKFVEGPYKDLVCHIVDRDYVNKTITIRFADNNEAVIGAEQAYDWAKKTVS